MIIYKSRRSINVWRKVFAWRPVRIVRLEVSDGKKVEASEIAFLTFVEKRVKYTAGVRQGVEYRWPEPAEQEEPVEEKPEWNKDAPKYGTYSSDAKKVEVNE